MKIVVARTAGFCMGVRRAVDLVLDAANRSQGPVYTYGPLIHNPQVLSMLEEKGITRLDAIPAKGSGIVLVRAHGVPPQDEAALKAAGFTVINATCPRVVRVQVIIRKYARKGYAAIIIGDKKHPEVKGLLGYAASGGHTVTSLVDLADLPRFENAVVVAQTTQNTAFWEQIRDWCQQNAPHYRLFDTICGSTEKRQAEIRSLAEASDGVVVVGGKQSGNTKRLAQISGQTGKPSVHVEDADEIDFSVFSKARSIAITAGASTPNWIIMETVRKVQAGLLKQNALVRFLFMLRDFLLKTNIMASAGAGSLAFACSTLQGGFNRFDHALTAMLYVLSMHIMNNLFSTQSDTYNHPERASFYRDNKSYLWVLAILSGATGLYLSLMSGLLPFTVLLVMSLLGLSYNLKLLPATPGNRKGMARIRDIPGSKTILIVLAWGTVTCLLPALACDCHPVAVGVVFVAALGMVFGRTAFFDILAVQGDRITGKETLPILLGEKKSLTLILAVLAGASLLLLVAGMSGILVKNAFWLAFIPLGMLLWVKFFEKERLISAVYAEFFMESFFIAAGLLAAVI